jgi:hypothetical protein
MPGLAGLREWVALASAVLPAPRCALGDPPGRAYPPTASPVTPPAGGARLLLKRVKGVTMRHRLVILTTVLAGLLTASGAIGFLLAEGSFSGGATASHVRHAVEAHGLRRRGPTRQPDHANARVKDLRDPEVAPCELRLGTPHDLHVVLRHRPPSIPGPGRRKANAAQKRPSRGRPPPLGCSPQEIAAAYPA